MWGAGVKGDNGGGASADLCRFRDCRHDRCDDLLQGSACPAVRSSSLCEAVQENLVNGSVGPVLLGTTAGGSTWSTEPTLSGGASSLPEVGINVSEVVGAVPT